VLQKVAQAINHMSLMMMVPAMSKWMRMIFLADLPNWSNLSQSDYTKAFEALPRPLPGSAPPGLTHSSEAFLKAYATKHSLNARAINDLVKDALKNPAFNANGLDTDMLQRLQASIDSGDIQIIISMNNTSFVSAVGCLNNDRRHRLPMH
jgi:hypothetical protein